MSIDVQPPSSSAVTRYEPRPGLRSSRVWLVAWLLWCAVLFGLYNAGAPHATCRAIDDAVSRGDFRLTPANAVDSVRAYLTNDGDLVRYFAYSNAVLGRPHTSHYVRTLSEWRGAFDADPEAAPMRTPGRPLLPYRDFLVEYPPGFFLWALPPALLAETVDAYRLLFGSAMALALTVALLLTLRVGRGAGAPPPTARVVGLAALAVFFVGSVATHRYDAVVALSLAVAVWGAIEERPFWLGMAMGVGAISKVVPVLAAPVLALYLLYRRRWSQLAVACAVAAVTGSLGLIPWLWGGSFTDVAAYHGLRPLQLESTLAAILGIWRSVGGPAIQMVQSYGSSNITGVGVESLSRLSTPLIVGSLVLVYGWTWLRLRGIASLEEGRLVVLRGIVGAMVAFMVLGRVFSPQYLVWLVPIGAMLSVIRGGASPWLFGGALALTQVIYPVTYSALQQLRPWAFGLVLLRNVLLVTWLWSLRAGRSVSVKG